MDNTKQRLHPALAKRGPDPWHSGVAVARLNLARSLTLIYTQAGWDGVYICTCSTENQVVIFHQQLCMYSTTFSNGLSLHVLPQLPSVSAKIDAKYFVCNYNY